MDTITKIGLKSKYKLNEAIFLNALETQLGSDWALKKTANPKCNVDFVVRKKNRVIGYIELKCRAELEKHKTLMIGWTKLNRLEERYKETIIVWFCVDTQTIWSCKYSTELLSSDDGWFNGSRVYYVCKSYCKTGMDNLLELCHIKRW